MKLLGILCLLPLTMHIIGVVLGKRHQELLEWDISFILSFVTVIGLILLTK